MEEGSGGPAPQEHLGELLERIQVEGSVQQALKLRQVRLLVAGGRGGCWVPAGVPAKKNGEGGSWHGPGLLPQGRMARASPHRLGTVNGGPEPGLHVVVVALVLVLLLAPGQLGVRVFLYLLQQQVEGER